MKDFLDRPIEVEEISQALKELKNDKSPGTDGFPANFYKIFYVKLKTFLHHLFLEIAETGCMHTTARQGILSLLEKIGKNPLNLASWCPLTLLNTDNKIYGKILANRLQQTFDKIIHHSQTGFVKGRHLAENILKINEVINYCDKHKEDGLLSFDFRKAFDTVEFEALFAVLARFGIGPKYLEMIMVLFTDPILYASNNGYWSEPIFPTRGTRQGCTYSPTIFTAVVEALGLAIRQNEEIRGIKLGEYEVKSGQFADDLWTTTPASENNLNAILQELQEYSDFSGLVINADKCAILHLGPFKNSDARYYMLKKLFWSPGPIKILGYEITTDLPTLFQSNYYSLFEKVDAIFPSWENRSLTPIGKITIVNTLVNSLFTHKFLALPTPPEDFFKQYKQRVTRFIWGENIPPKAAYNKIIQKYERLGLQLVDLKSKDLAMKATWPVRWSERELKETSWLYTEYPVKDERIWQCNISSKDIIQHITDNSMASSAYILYAWAVVNFQPVLETPEEILDTVLWGNSMIHRQNKPLFDKRILNSNIDRILQIFNLEELHFLMYQELVDEYGKVYDELTYYAILAAIPPQWKIQIKANRLQKEIDCNSRIENYAISKSPSKAIYWQIVQKQCISSSALKCIWERELETSLEDDRWNSLYDNFRKKVKPTKLQYMQYKILTRTLVTNVKRNKWDSKVDPNCTFCNSHLETIDHLLWSCEKVTKFREKVVQLIKYLTKVHIKVKKIAFMLNENDARDSILDLTYVAMKQYIYSTKCKNETLSCCSFMCKMSDWYQVDKQWLYEHYSKTNEKKIEKKWKGIYD